MWNSTITRKNILTKSHWTRNRNYSRLRTFLGPLLWAIPSRQLVMENLKSYLYVHCQPTRKLWKVYSTRYLEKDWIMSSTWRGLLLMHSVSHSVHMVPTGPCFACEASMVFNTMCEQSAITLIICWTEWPRYSASYRSPSVHLTWTVLPILGNSSDFQSWLCSARAVTVICEEKTLKMETEEKSLFIWERRATNKIFPEY